MSYKIEQKINGKVYVYKVESYWDKEKKQPRQRRIYLGRKDEKTGRIVDTQKISLPKSSKNFGSSFLILKIIKELGLLDVLKDIFPKEYKAYLSLAMYKILSSEPYYLYNYWQENTFYSEEIDNKRISDLLQDLGESDKQIESFFVKWIKINKGKQTIMFDITSISSYSENNELVEYGYNRDKEDLEQINLGIISKEFNGTMNIPLAYRLYPGSINDVSTLNNIIELIDQFKLSLWLCVLDRGFYSKNNIREMHKKGLKYILSVPFSTKLAKEQAIQNINTLSLQSSSFSYRKTIYYHIKKNVTIDNINSTLHIYLDKEKKAREEIKLLSKLSELEAKFKKNQFKTTKEANGYIIDVTKSRKKYFSVKKVKGVIAISRNQKFIESELATQGLFMIITNSNELDKCTILENYRNKDGAEKIFQSLKTDIKEKRMRTKTLNTMRGNIFINFISLIILSKINNTMNEKNLYKTFSKKELFKTLDKLKIFRLDNDKKLLAEITKQQKLIFKAFNLKPSYNFTGF